MGDAGELEAGLPVGGQADRESGAGNRSAASTTGRASEGDGDGAITRRRDGAAGKRAGTNTGGQRGHGERSKISTAGQPGADTDGEREQGTPAGVCLVRAAEAIDPGATCRPANGLRTTPRLAVALRPRFAAAL
jgi:hypothetical protein